MEVADRTWAAVEQARAEALLRESERQFKTLADRVPTFVWLADSDGEVTYFNERWFAYTGLNKANGDTTEWTSAVHPDDLAAVLGRWREAVSIGVPYEIEARYLSRDGNYRWFVSRAEPLTTSSGQVTGWFGTSTDIHQRRLAEEDLKAETEALEILNRSGATIAAEIDLERVVQAVTDAGVELSKAQFGAFFYNVEDDSGESYTLYTISGVSRDHFAQFPMPRNTAVFEPTFRGDAVVRSNDITKDPRYGKSSPHWGMPKGHLPVKSYLAVPVTSRNGDVIGGLFFGHPEPAMFSKRSERLIVGIATQASIAIDKARLYRAAQREIAERLRKEEALQVSEEFNRSVVESSGDCILVLNLDGVVEYINGNGCRLMEIEQAFKDTKRAYLDFWSEDSRPVAAEAINVALQGSTGRFSAMGVTTKPTSKWWDVVITAVPGLNKEPLRLVSIARDITAQKNAEDTRQLLLRELHHRVKNLFAIISGMVSMTARGSTSVQEMATGLRGRIFALAKAHELIRSAITFEPEQPEQGISLQSLLAQVAEPHLAQMRADQFSMDGPEVLLGVSSATSFALIFHELATNSAKYGALGSSDGCLDVSWVADGDWLRLRWCEIMPSGAVEVPKSEGFGTKLARSSATGQLGGSIDYQWRSDGVEIGLTAALKQLVR